jgi:hypothetical protein
MKQLLALLVIIACAGFTQLHAQDKSKERAQRLTDTMTIRLGLTADQIPKVQAINEEFATKAADVKNSGAGKLGKFKKIKSAGKDRNEALKEVLTDEQYKQYLEQQKETREEMKQKYKEKKG